MMVRIITDFDGPIINVSSRYYDVYQHCLEEIKLPKQKVNKISKKEFWNLKRSCISEKEIALISGLDENQSNDFARLRKNTIHNLSYLRYDTIIPNTIATLELLQKMNCDLVVMTMRKQKELQIAFEKYNLGRFFSPERRYCLPDDYVKTLDIQDKPLLMNKVLKELPTAIDVWMVGDTEADILAAKTHSIKVIGVLSGIRDRNQLERYKPDHITENLEQAVTKIMSSFYCHTTKRPVGKSERIEEKILSTGQNLKTGTEKGFDKK